MFFFALLLFVIRLSDFTLFGRLFYSRRYRMSSSNKTLERERTHTLTHARQNKTVNNENDMK